jgi:hypothetical protein
MAACRHAGEPGDKLAAGFRLERVGERLGLGAVVAGCIGLHRKVPRPGGLAVSLRTA